LRPVGAETSDLFTPDAEAGGTERVAQITSVKADTKYVSITIGGNDLGFASALGQCVFGSYLGVTVSGHRGCAGRESLRAALGDRIAALAGVRSATSPAGTGIHSVLSVLLQIHAAAPRAKIYIAGYPRLFGAFSGTCDLGKVTEEVPLVGHVSGTAKISSKDAGYVNQVVQALDDLVANAAQDARAAGVDVAFVDVDPYFETHRLCDSGPEWINGVSGSGSLDGAQHVSAATFHPTAIGQRAGYEAAFVAAGLGHRQ
jgi:lysophospholipase L1-like esterase